MFKVVPESHPKGPASGGFPQHRSISAHCGRLACFPGFHSMAPASMLYPDVQKLEVQPSLPRQTDFGIAEVALRYALMSCDGGMVL